MRGSPPNRRVSSTSVSSSEGPIRLMLVRRFFKQICLLKETFLKGEMRWNWNSLTQETGKPFGAVDEKLRHSAIVAFPCPEEILEEM